MSCPQPLSYPYSRFSETDIYLFRQGSHFQLFDKFGSHIVTVDEQIGVYFAVWAPYAKEVFVSGSFNDWHHTSHPLYSRWDHSGVWECFVPGVQKGSLYKYRIEGQNGTSVEKSDPFALLWEIPPKTASVVWDLDYLWEDESWMEERSRKNSFSSPISIYEMHYGSWRRNEHGHSLSYREMAKILPEYIQALGFTHIEFMPMMEHPFFGSWGYQKTGFFAPSSRYGTPQDFMHLIDTLHREGIGVYLDWVPSHFPADVWGLSRFDGSCLFEHEDPRQGKHPDWDTLIFNYGRHEVRSFLISSAIFWLDKYHIDGLRVDAVSSMLYLNYSRKEGEWIPNAFGGYQNLEAMEFLKELNTYVYRAFPDVQMIAEESTDWPMVSRPVFMGGLGFGMKWNMGWMHDTLSYFQNDPVHRKYHHGNILFNMHYFYQENFILSISHDEVVYGKGSLLKKMPGDDWNKWANFRAFLGYMFTHPGKKLLFMGTEIGQWKEWNHDGTIDWHLLEFDAHRRAHQFVADLNRLYTSEIALHDEEFHPEGFAWVEMHDQDNSVFSYLRKSQHAEQQLLVFCNFTPIPRMYYSVDVLYESSWQEIFNSDHTKYGGTGQFSNMQIINTSYEGTTAGRLVVDLPPLSTIVLKKI